MKDTLPDLYVSIRNMHLKKQSLLQQERHFMFILERIRPDRVNLPRLSRQWNLSEQDIVRLLLEDKSNKEIAHALGLSLNTIKSYMKFLMRKVGVTTHAGIVSRLLVRE